MSQPAIADETPVELDSELREGLITAAEFRSTYSIGITTFYKLLEDGELAAVKLGRSTLVDRAEARRWRKSLRPQGAAPATPAVERETDLKKGLMSAAEFRRDYSVGLTTFYKLLGDGHLAGVKRGRSTLIDRAEARRWRLSLPGFMPNPEKAGRK